MCVLIASITLVEKFLILKRSERDITINVHRCSGKVPVIVVRFEWKLNFWTDFSKKPKISNLMKIHLLVAELFHADRQTGIRTDRRTHIKKLIVALRNFGDASEKKTGTAIPKCKFVYCCYISVCNNYHQWLTNSDTTADLC